MRKLSGHVLATAAATAVLLGCSDAVGVGGDSVTGDGPAAEATVVLQAGVAQPVVEAVLASLTYPDDPGGNGDHGARITPDQVESLLLVVEHVEVLPSQQLQERVRARNRWREANEPQNQEGRGFHNCERHDDWYALDVLANGEIDLMALPVEEGDGLVLAAGEIPAGEYKHARLFVSSATIRFNETIERPSGVVFEAGEYYEVYVPSADVSGIKTQAGFIVSEGTSEVVLAFDGEATLRHVVVTAEGTIVVPPVFMSYGRSGT
jgi:hypothetical protein